MAARKKKASRSTWSFGSREKTRKKAGRKKKTRKKAGRKKASKKR